MGRNGRMVLGILFAGMILAVVAFLTLVGIYTVKIRRGEPIAGVTDRFTRGSQRVRAVTISPELATKITDATGDPSFGPADAPIQIVEFADAQCPYSAEFSTVLRKAMLKYPDKFRLVFRDFPLNDIHEHATGGAIALSCANAQGRFLPMHDKVFSNQDKLAPKDLLAYAEQIGLAMDAFRECLINPEVKKEVIADTATGLEAGVVGTPTFFINGNKVEGAIPENLFEKLLLNSK